MPFTPSHAVVALPFIRTPLIPAAIAIGAMTPDLPLFLRGTPLTYGLTHSVGGLLVTVLTAFVLLLVWRCVLRPAVRELSPAWLAVRLPPEWDRGAAAAARDTVGRLPGGRYARGHLVLVALSLLLGVLTHMVWDAFTHEGRWGVAVFPALGDAWGPFTGFKWLQYGSGVVGIAVIAAWALLRLRTQEATGLPARMLPRAVRAAWWLSLPAVLVGAWVIGLALYGPLDAEFTVAHLAYRVLPPACALWGAGTVALAAAVQLLRRRSSPRDGAGTPATSA
ncbi:DUF4184 family protein [Microbacterium sp. zg.Y1090]|uniref:DUF4184 family protein n=1 Tax=Microbacterium TaxID=33882 RepID=UPI00214AB877|nr:MULTISPECIES: DUF4184 family protein [unclassified Microbacterium]MCR2813708.1 DUF4184 family protein [Microbacterium sp. zg.Y1084]MCR2819778.1 DUF4184 family protein [Microbacterium sp. zg.Y1090]MDL5488248.1 DUF4184 family protein [Microbacterium sp. zg-Y1211]WIM27983.1 DUF4184 family protein [Microbacterium sp. zg-Y1090]